MEKELKSFKDIHEKMYQAKREEEILKKELV